MQKAKCLQQFSNLVLVANETNKTWKVQVQVPRMRCLPEATSSYVSLEAPENGHVPKRAGLVPFDFAKEPKELGLHEMNNKS